MTFSIIYVAELHIHFFLSSSSFQFFTYRNDSEDSIKKGPKSGGRVAIGVTVFYLCRVICVIFSTNCYLFATNQEKNGLTNIISPCLSKVGQNCFEPDNEAFIAWLDSLTTNALYKSMLEAHTATKL